MKTRLKVLHKNMVSPFQGKEYELNIWYHCRDFDDDISKDCSRGHYATEVDGLPYSFELGSRVFKCSVKGRAVEYNRYKMRYENIRLDREIEYEELKEMAKKEEGKLGYKLSEILFPFDPFAVNIEKVDSKHIELLYDWISLFNSVLNSVRWSVCNAVSYTAGDSVWKCVKASMRDSIWETIWNSIWGGACISTRASVWESMKYSAWDSLMAYISSLFPNIKSWEGIEHEEGVNPFQAGIDLWRSGLVPSFDGETWRLHNGSRILYEAPEEDIKQIKIK